MAPRSWSARETKLAASMLMVLKKTMLRIHWSAGSRSFVTTRNIGEGIAEATIANEGFADERFFTGQKTKSPLPPGAHRSEFRYFAAGSSGHVRVNTYAYSYGNGTATPTATATATPTATATVTPDSDGHFQRQQLQPRLPRQLRPRLPQLLQLRLLHCYSAATPTATATAHNNRLQQQRPATTRRSQPPINADGTVSSTLTGGHSGEVHAHPRWFSHLCVASGNFALTRTAGAISERLTIRLRYVCRHGSNFRIR